MSTTMRNILAMSVMSNAFSRERIDDAPARITEALEAMQHGDLDRANGLLSGECHPTWVTTGSRPSGISSEVVRDPNPLPKGRGARRREAAQKRKNTGAVK